MHPSTLHTDLELLPGVIAGLAQFLQLGLRDVNLLFKLVSLLGMFDTSVGCRALRLGFELG